MRQRRQAGRQRPQAGLPACKALARSLASSGQAQAGPGAQLPLSTPAGTWLTRRVEEINASLHHCLVSCQVVRLVQLVCPVAAGRARWLVSPLSQQRQAPSAAAPPPHGERCARRICCSHHCAHHCAHHCLMDGLPQGGPGLTGSGLPMTRRQAPPPTPQALLMVTGKGTISCDGALHAGPAA